VVRVLVQVVVDSEPETELDPDPDPEKVMVLVPVSVVTPTTVAPGVRPGVLVNVVRYVLALVTTTTDRLVLEVLAAQSVALKTA